MSRQRKSGLPPYVRIRHGSYHYERPGVASKKLCRVDEGIAAMHTALGKRLAELTLPGLVEKGMPKLCREWMLLDHKEFGLRRYRPKVRKEYERMLGKISEWFVNFDVHQVKTHHVAKVLDAQFPNKARTHNAYRALMALLFKWAIRQGLRQDNPCSGTVMASMTEDARSRYLSPDELAIIRANGGRRLSLFIDLAIITGQRVGDLLALNWGDVRDEGIVFNTSKERVTIAVKMTPELRETLNALRGGSNIEPMKTMPVVTTQTGDRYTYSGIYSAWRKACMPQNKLKQRVMNAHIHDLRHNAMTDAHNQGLDPQALAGHKSQDMTARYIEKIELTWVQPVRLNAPK